MADAIEDIEGIGPKFGEKLRALGLKTTDALLERAKDRKGRSDLAEALGVDEGRILKWANHADLMRIKGVGGEFAELLEAAGVDTVKELKTRNAANLAKAMADANAAKALTRVSPSEAVVAKWIAEAKELPAILTY